MAELLADVGFMGLSSVGRDLILNMNDKGITVLTYARNSWAVDRFLESDAKGTGILGAHSLPEFISRLKTPRKIFLMVKAGSAVDDFILHFEPLLDPADIIIDLADSHYLDTARRTRELEERSLLFVGCGIGNRRHFVRTGLCLSPGGSPDAWPAIQDILQQIAAQADGRPCCDWVAGGGAGHFVKMMQPGLAFSNMQLIAEAYEMLHRILGLNEDDIAEIFAKWNQGILKSVLLDATVTILKFKDEDGEPMIRKILDGAGQKAIGTWAAIEALEHDVCFSITTQAIFGRFVSRLKKQRTRASRIFDDPQTEPFSGNKQTFVDDLEQAVYAGQVMSYSQTFILIAEIAKKNKWILKYRSMVHIWQGGCIIAGDIITRIVEAYTRAPQLDVLINDEFFHQAIETAQPGWRRTVSEGVLRGVALPCLSAALAFFDGYRSADSPANLIQAQRDYFGGHTVHPLPEEGKTSFNLGEHRP
ncbi:6-phosphogluconate dehydrogenase [Mycena capillaripes]|nr:6-phosphogluconate dehydrogenase [Mycena capillaripes]